jgi:hypothetical protein
MFVHRFPLQEFSETRMNFEPFKWFTEPRPMREPDYCELEPRSNDYWSEILLRHQRYVHSKERHRRVEQILGMENQVAACPGATTGVS